VRLRASLGPAVVALAAAVVAGTTGALLAPAGALVGLRDAEARQEALEDALGDVTVDLEAREEQIESVEQELAGLGDQDRALQDEYESVRQQLALRARAAFMTGGGTVFEAVISGDGPGAAVERAALLDALALGDSGSLETAAALRTRIEQTRQLREGLLSELEALRTEFEADLVVLNRELEAAASEVRTLELLSRRQRDIDLPWLQGIYSCPVGDPVVFRDTWGDPRSGGRSHKGVDMFAAHGTPVYAIVAGRITRMNNNGLGGISLYMFGDDGNEYYYTHLQGYAAGVGVGDRVGPGDLVAYNGSSGNADAFAPHVHFQVHPGGGAPVNPYPYAAAACGRWQPGQSARGGAPGR
jgi:murein DD-endopeptidase MepM/ murein hydrolase activator NlpD